MPPKRCRAKPFRGFTLIEVMVTVAIIAILASIAVPIYNGYIERSYIQQGLQHLSEARTRMEQYFMDNRTYLNGTDCGFDVSKLVPANSTTEKFGLECKPSGDGYVVTAKGKTGTPMDGFTYTIDQRAIGTTTITKTGWNSGSCWIMKKGETCS